MKVFSMFFMIGTTSESLVFSEGSHHYAVRSKLINPLLVIHAASICKPVCKSVLSLYHCSSF